VKLKMAYIVDGINNKFNNTSSSRGGTSAQYRPFSAISSSRNRNLEHYAASIILGAAELLNLKGFIM